MHYGTPIWYIFCSYRRDSEAQVSQSSQNVKSGD